MTTIGGPGPIVGQPDHRDSDGLFEMVMVQGDLVVTTPSSSHLAGTRSSSELLKQQNR